MAGYARLILEPDLHADAIDGRTVPDEGLSRASADWLEFTSAIEAMRTGAVTDHRCSSYERSRAPASCWPVTGDSVSPAGRLGSKNPHEA
jgi:hypothetical protein